MELFLLWLLIVLFAVAALVDNVMTDSRVQQWRQSTREMRRKIAELDLDAAIKRVNSLFCELFDTVYSAQYWSARRIARSYFSSLFAVGTAALLLNWETTTFGRLEGYTGEEFRRHLAGLLVGVLLLNPCADFISLQETRWILGRSRNAGPGKLVLLGVLDLAFTFCIYVVFFSVLGHVFMFVSNHPEGQPSVEKLVGALFKRDEGFTFFVSTFFTSVFWFLFLGSMLCIRVMKRNSRLLRLLLETVGESRMPARTTAGVMAIMLVAAYGIARIFNWVIAI